jgi:predicted ATP-dependent protease
LLSGRLKGTASNRVAVAVSVALIAAIASAALMIVVYLDQSSELAEKSQLVLSLEQEILAARQSVEAQREELGAKNAELAQAQSRIAALSQELSAAVQSLQEESNNAILLEAEISTLSERTDLLHAESTALQSKIAADEKRIAELTRVSTSTDKITISHFGLGVDQNNEGIVFPIRVMIMESGSGILSVDINNVQYEPGFQAAVRAAAMAAAKYSGENLAGKDIIVRFSPDGSPVGGELVKVDGSSAGAVIAAMIAAGLSDTQLDNSILVTGSINEDGTVGRIGSLEEKLEAADGFGAKAVLVPESQQFESQSVQVIGVSDIDELMAHMSVS